VIRALKYSQEAVMKTLLTKGEKVRHNKMTDWGVGKIVSVDRCGTIQVIFEGNRKVSIAKGAKYLVKSP